MKKILWGLLLPAFLGIASCKKESNTPSPVKFMSFAAGNEWVYKSTDNSSGATQTDTVKATGNDSAANGRIYKVYSNTGGPNEYYNNTGSDYYTFRSLHTSFIDTSLEVLYLKDDLAVNGTWPQNVAFSVEFFGTQIPLVLTLTNKIAQKGITKVVNGVTYNNVTDVQTVLTVTGVPALVTYSLASDIHYYYAPKIGQIENKTLINFSAAGLSPTTVNQKMELQSSTIL